MNAYILKLLVGKISYVYCLDGDIVPVVNIYPPFLTPDGHEISRFPLFQMQLLDDAAWVTAGDEIEICLQEDPTAGSPTMRILTHSEQPRVNHLNGLCPICGGTLMPAVQGESMGRCINRSCMAQISTNVMHFLGAMPVELTPPFVKVLTANLSKGCITSLFQLFKLVPEDIYNGFSDYNECLMFLYHLHSIRGRTSLGQLIRGMRIPFWSEMDYVTLENYLVDKDINWSNYMEIFNLPNQEDRPDLPWHHFVSLFERQENYELFNSLAWVLLH